MAPARSAPHVVVIGGGFAGATCAKYLRRWSLALDLRIIARTVALVLFDRQAY
jgi:glycine/D-amino acid oxidase-like deaminating enzyme